MVLKATSLHSPGQGSWCSAGGQQAHTPAPLAACLVLTSFTQAFCVRLTLLGRLFPKMLLFRALAHGLSLKCPTRWRRPSPPISTVHWHPFKSRPGLGRESGREARRPHWERSAAEMRSSVSQVAPESCWLLDPEVKGPGPLVRIHTDLQGQEIRRLEACDTDVPS